MILEEYVTTVMRLLWIAPLLLMMHCGYAQEVSPFAKFGKVTIEDLQRKIYSIDSNANAVVLSDIGEASIEGNSKFSFSISFTHHRVVHILNKNGYDEATVEIYLYSDGDVEEKLESLKATTYNLENGKIVESKLAKSSIFEEKMDKNHILKKFTFPNVKEGSIIECEYTLISDYVFNLQPWYFQGETPVMWSEYKLSVPQFFTYTFLSYGYHSFQVNERKNRTANFVISDSKTTAATEHYNLSAGVTDYRWVMKDVPELKEENFTSSIKNHIARIEFQLASQNYPLIPRDYRNTWPALVSDLLQAPDFGEQLNSNNSWLAAEIRPLIKGVTPETEKAKRIYAFVRDHFTCTNYSAFTIEKSLKSVLKSKKGSVAEINLLLTVMLRYAGLKSDPVILSTRDHGFAWEDYPVMHAFNYVLSQCMVDNQTFYLDATHPLLAFAKLLPDCYNGHARVVNDSADAVYFKPDSLLEKKTTALFITNDPKGKWTGSVNQTPGFYESYVLRNEIAEKGEKEFFKEIEKGLGQDVRLISPHIDSLFDYDAPVVLKYGLELDLSKEDIMYVNPMFNEGWKTNPFKLAQRNYPVEMPYAKDETYLLTMEVPLGYVVDELPKQMIVKFDEKGSAYFEYRISQSGSIVSLMSRIKINRTLYSNEEYKNLRTFFNLIVNKQNEQIVFKKKK